MSGPAQDLGDAAVPAGLNGIYVVPVHAIDFEHLPLRVRGRLVTAIAPHPRDDERFYVTTERPDALAFLPEPFVDLSR